MVSSSAAHYNKSLFEPQTRQGRLRATGRASFPCNVQPYGEQGIVGHRTVPESSTQSLPLPVGASKVSWYQQAHPQPALQPPVPRLALNAHVDLLGQELAKLRQQKHGFMQDLLIGRVPVKVTESASI